MNALLKIIKNMGVILSSQILACLFGLIYTIYMARFLGAEGFGIISFATAFNGIFIVFIDFGLNTLTTRDVARDNTLTQKYLKNTLMIKLFLSIITIILTLILVNILGYPSNVANVVYVFTISTILYAFTQNLNSIFQSFEKMEYQSVGTIINNLLILFGTYIGIIYTFDVIGFAFVYLFSNLFLLIYSISIYKIKFNININKSKLIYLNIQTVKIMLTNAFPIFISALASIISFKIDILLLSVIKNNSVVGIYSAAYKPIEVMLFIPAAFTIAILPMLSKLYVSDSSLNKIEYAFEKSFKYLFLISLIIAVMVTFYSNEIIIILYSNKFVESIMALKILIWTIPSAFLTYITGTLLVSINRQKTILKISVISMFANILLNLIFIPYLGFIGAAIVTVFTQVLLLIMYYISISKILINIKIKEIIIKPIIPIMLVVSLIYILKILCINNLIVIIMSILIYFILLFILKIIDKSDIELFKNILKKNKL